MSIVELLLTIIFFIFIPVYLIFSWKQARTERETIRKIKRKKPDNMYFGQDKH